jgi:hypothetical protein
VATVEPTAAEVAEAPGSDPQPAQEDAPEVVYGRDLLLKPVKVPFPRLMVKAQRVMEEMEAGLQQEWEELEAERHRLADWEHRLGERIEAVTFRNARREPSSSRSVMSYTRRCAGPSTERQRLPCGRRWSSGGRRRRSRGTWRWRRR